MPAKKVLSLGQCGADHGSIARLLNGQFGAQVVAAATFEEALQRLRSEPFDLVLINRVLDFNGASGLDFLPRLQEDANLKSVPVMLVSNYEDAQKKAVAQGALPGFGKSALRDPNTLARLRAVLSPPEEQP